MTFIPIEHSYGVDLLALLFLSADGPHSTVHSKSDEQDAVIWKATTTKAAIGYVVSRGDGNVSRGDGNVVPQGI